MTASETDITTLSNDELAKIIRDAAAGSIWFERRLKPEYVANPAGMSEEEIDRRLTQAFLGELPPEPPPVPEWQKWETIEHSGPKLCVHSELSFLIFRGDIIRAKNPVAIDKFPEAVAAHEELVKRLPALREQWKAQQAAAHEERRQREAQRWLEENIPRKYWGATLEGYSPTTSSQQIALEKLRSWDGSGRYFWLTGPTGTGKTHLLCAKYRTIGAFADTGLFVTEDGLLNRWRKAHKAYKERDSEMPTPDDVLAEYIGVDWLFLDDLGSARLTEAALDALWSVILERDAQDRVTITSSNFKPSELVKTYGKRFISRLTSGTTLQIDGDDYRVKQAAASIN